MVDDDGLADILHEVITSTAGINRVILADKTGLTLAHTAKFDFDETIDIDGLGAISSAVYLASETQGANVHLKDMQVVIAEFVNGKIMVANCGPAVLCLITDNNIAIGMVRMLMKQAAKKIQKILDVRMGYEEEIFEPMDFIPEELPGELDVDSDDEDLLQDLESALKDLQFF